MKNLFSPTMLRRFLSCKYKIFNEINEEKLKLKRIELKKMINSGLRREILMKKSILGN